MGDDINYPAPTSEGGEKLVIKMNTLKLETFEWLNLFNKFKNTWKNKTNFELNCICLNLLEVFPEYHYFDRILMYNKEYNFDVTSILISNFSILIKFLK